MVILLRSSRWYTLSADTPFGREGAESADMKHLLWIVPLGAGLAAMVWPKLMSVALLAMVVCGVVWIASLVLGTRGSSLDRPGNDDRAEQNRDPYGVQRDLPPPS
jgi:hypothetical protein